VVGEALAGEALHAFGVNRVVTGVQVTAAAVDHGQDLPEGGVLAEFGIEAHRHVDERIGGHHHRLDSAGPRG